MSKLSSDPVRDYSEYNRMSTEELQEILRKDALEDGESAEDEDTIYYVLEVLLKRQMKEPTRNVTDIDTAWRSFQKNYQPFANRFENLYDVDEIDEHKEDAEEQQVTAIRKKNRFLRNISRVVAAMLIVVCTGAFVTTALGIGIEDVLAYWTDTIFSFRDRDDNTTTEYDDMRLKRTIEEYNIPEGCIPTWSPDGYRLSEMQIIPADDSSVLSLSFVYHNGNNGMEYYIDIKNLDYSIPSTYEKDEDKVVIYESNTQKYYINSNNNTYSAVWECEQYECAIIGDLSYTEITKLVDSIR